MKLTPKLINLLPDGLVVAVFWVWSIVPVKLEVLPLTTDEEDSNWKILPLVSIPTLSVWSFVVSLKCKDLSLKYFSTLVSLSYAAMKPVAILLGLSIVKSWVISSPISGVPVTEVNLNPCNDEYVLSKYNELVPTFVGFFTIPTCENLVLVGKSLVVSSNLA